MKTNRTVWVWSLVLILAWMLSASATGERAAWASNGGFHKVIAPSGLLKPGTEGIELVEEYGSFTLYSLSDSALANLPQPVRDQVTVKDEMDQILIDSFADPSSTEILPENYSLQASGGYGLQLIQFAGPIKDEWLEAIKASGSQLVHYVPNNAYLVWTGDQGRNELSFMASSSDFLQLSAAYRPYYKLGKSLKERASTVTDPEEVLRVGIQMYRHPGQGMSEAVIDRLSVEKLSSWTPLLNFQIILVKLRAADLPTVAGLPDVVWIGEQFPPELLDEVQGQILAGNMDETQSSPSGPGYLDWLKSYGFSQDPMDYPVVDIVDDGIGDGTTSSGDPTFHVAGDIHQPTRLAYNENCTPATDGGGVDGHGHLNASILGGYDGRSGLPYQDSMGFNLGLGINPFGRLAGTRVFYPVSDPLLGSGSKFDLSRCGDNNVNLIQSIYQAGARISSNSWGCGSSCGYEYDEFSYVYDTGARDADQTEPGNQQMIFIFAAGNDGKSGPGTIQSPGNAKNVITVGASENFRPDWTDHCNIGPAGADDAMDIINFSSRGPAPGGRVKPELVAPGTHIQGTASTNPAYMGSEVCDPYYPENQNVFAASSGTSHSTPAIAGAASLYYYWLEHTYHIDQPSPAMIKAYLIAHPSYLTGENAGDTLPSNNQGYGMPNMKLAFDDTPRYLVDQSVLLDHTGQTWSFHGSVADPSKPVRVVMAYTDQAALPGSSSPLVNDLDLKVTTGSVMYLGNHFNGQWSAPDGSPDSKNNYEAIFLPAGASGSLEITISALNIAGDGVPDNPMDTDQDFALVCYNCLKTEDFSLSVPQNQGLCTLGKTESEILVDASPGYSSPVTLSAKGLPQGVTAGFNQNPVTPPGSSLMTLTGDGSAAVGSYFYKLTGSALGKTHSASINLNVYTSGPQGQPNLTSPEYAAKNLPLRPKFTWDPVADALTYDVEIASDNQFEHIVASATGLKITSYTLPQDLRPNAFYFWRVQAHNPCGSSLYSKTSLFFTLSLPGDCAVGVSPLIVFQEDFESEAAKWTSGGLENSWNLSGNRTHSGQSAYHAYDINVISDQKLTSPPVFLPQAQELPSLRFWNYQAIEHKGNDTSIDGCYDGAIVEISEDNGITWSQAPDENLLTDPYDGLINVSNSSNPLKGLPAWCGDPQNWLNSVIDMENYRGKTVQFRFRLATDYGTSREGWYIDDIAVQGCPAPQDVSLTGNRYSGSLPGHSVTYPFTVTNASDFPLTFVVASTGKWESTLDRDLLESVGPGERIQLSLTVRIPQDSDLGDNDRTKVSVIAVSDPSIYGESWVETTAGGVFLPLVFKR
jgi:hypothetical protein